MCLFYLGLQYLQQQPGVCPALAYPGFLEA